MLVAKQGNQVLLDPRSKKVFFRTAEKFGDGVTFEFDDTYAWPRKLFHPQLTGLPSELAIDRDSRTSVLRIPGPGNAEAFLNVETDKEIKKPNWYTIEHVKTGYEH